MKILLYSAAGVVRPCLIGRPGEDYIHTCRLERRMWAISHSWPRVLCWGWANAAIRPTMRPAEVARMRAARYTAASWALAAQPARGCE